MLQKGSPEPMENSSGYVSNISSSMRPPPPPVKYATVGRSRPGGVKRTSSLVVTQPVVPPAVYKAPPRQRELRKHYKNDLSRPSSQASRSSGGSGGGGRRPSSRSSREAVSERLSRQRAGSARRSSYSKVRRPESRTSSKALILRRRESSRREAPQRSASIRSTRETREARPDSRASQATRQPAGKPSRSIFSSWKPRITLRRSKSLQVKPEPVKKREIRFGDEYEPSVITMKGVEHRRLDAGPGTLSTRTDPQLSRRPTKPDDRRMTQTLNRPPRRTSPPSRLQRASSAEAARRLDPLGEALQGDSPRARRYRPNDRATRAPSELSSSSPRAPVWRADSDGSLSDTMTARSRGSTVRSARHGDKYVARSQRSGGRASESSNDRKNAGVMGFLRRKFSIKPRDKPSPAPVMKRERASSSSLSSLERPARHSKLKTAKSHEVLTIEPRRDESVDERNAYRSLPRSQYRGGGGGTTLSRRLSSLGWAAVGRSAERSHSLRDGPRNNERLDLAGPPAVPKATNETSRGRPRPAADEEPIQPIILQRRALSQPSLFHPAEEPPQEPFTHYANLPFQLSARHRSSPDLTEPLASAPAARAVSQPSLVAAGAGRYSSGSCSSLDSPDEWRRTSRGRGPAHGGTHRKGILKRQRSTERRPDRREDGVKNVNITRDVGKQSRPRQHGMLHDLAHNIKNVFRHRKGGDKQPTESSRAAALPSADSVVSERYINVTNTHEEHESGRREEEVHHLGSVSSEELQRAIRGGVDARQLAQRQSSASGQVADPLAPPQRRLLHQHGRNWRTVDTDDLHETSRHGAGGELLTESAHTHQHEEFHNVQVPDDGSDEEAREQVRSSSHSRRHTKDVDMLEHFSVPRGGRLADGIKLGDGLRYVQENVEEQHQGDADLSGATERIRDMHRLGFRPPGQTSTPIEYQPAESNTKRKQTGGWRSNQPGSESGHSRSSEEGETRTRPSGRSGRNESDRRRETNTYEYQQSSGTKQRGAAPPESWQRSEKYTREVRETPERTYIKETRQSPRGGYERLQVLPAGSAQPPPSSALSDMVSEFDEDPIFASKFSSGKPRSGGAGLTFNSVLREEPERRPRPPSPAASPPPAAPPRTKRKNRLKKQSQSVPPPPAPPPEPVAEPTRLVEMHREVRQTPPRQMSASERDSTPVRVETTQHEDGRVVKEYHFRSSESPQRPVRRGSSATRDSPPDALYRGYSLDEPDAGRRGPRAGSGTARLHQSSEQLDRWPAEPTFTTQTVDRRRPGRHDREPAFQTQTLPRKPREVRNPPPAGRLGAPSSFGGSMINVSVRNNVLGQPAARRSNSFYEEQQQKTQPASVGLKSPDIISAIQRTASVRQDEPPRRAETEVLRRNTENLARSGTPETDRRPAGLLAASVGPPPPPPPPPATKVAPKVAPKPRPATKENFMRGLMQNAPELYSALHGDERKDSKTPSPKQSPPPSLHRARSPASPAPVPLDYGVIYPKTPPVFKRIERLRADEEVVTKEGRSRSTTPAEDVHNFRLGTMSATGERTELGKVQR